MPEANDGDRRSIIPRSAHTYTKFILDVDNETSKPEITINIRIYLHTLTFRKFQVTTITSVYAAKSAMPKVSTGKRKASKRLSFTKKTVVNLWCLDNVVFIN